MLNNMKDFDLDSLERKNIYNIPDNLFENIQEKVMQKVDMLDIEKLDRKNIYKVSENLFEEVQQNVLKEIEPNKKETPIFNIKWGYAIAASLALIFGFSFLYNSNLSNLKSTDNELSYAMSTKALETQQVYETLQEDIAKIEEPIYTSRVEENKREVTYKEEKVVTRNVNQKTSADRQMTEILDAFNTSEIAELANNSSQDVYLDIYNY